jgi:monofunctional glycosyltransferase
MMWLSAFQGACWQRRALKFISIVVGVVIACVLLLQCWYLGNIVWWKYRAPTSTSFMHAQELALHQTNPSLELSYDYVDYTQISDHLKRAVIAAEDANFAVHEGVDWDAIERAYDQNLKKGKVVRGGSTITMQLAKNLFLSGQRSYWRKGQELVITYMLEAVHDKQSIFELYLNVAEWGVGVFGAQAAARHYYGVSAKQLSHEQAARMAAMLPNPRFYDKNRSNRYLLRRSNLISRGMSSVQLPE